MIKCFSCRFVHWRHHDAACLLRIDFGYTRQCRIVAQHCHRAWFERGFWIKIQTRFSAFSACQHKQPHFQFIDFFEWKEFIKMSERDLTQPNPEKDTDSGLVTESDDSIVVKRMLSMISPSKRPLPRPLFGFSPLKRYVHVCSSLVTKSVSDRQWNAPRWNARPGQSSQRRNMRTCTQSSFRPKWHQWNENASASSIHLRRPVPAIR